MGKYESKEVAFAKDSGISQQVVSGTDSSQAITQHSRAGKITSSTTNLGAKTTQDITVTNRYCKSGSIILCSVSGGGTGDVVVSRVTPSAGSFIVTILNADPSNACNAAYVVRYIIFNVTV
ncbi:MAG: hypothetical protein ACOZBH_04520 [Patescibacteria group bacterium]